MLRIHVLGEFRVEADGVVLGDANWPRRDVKRLLQLLAVRHAHRLGREEIAEILWPGVAGEAGRNRLYNIVYLLRGVLEPQRPARAPSSFVHSGAEMLHLGPAQALWIDADAFEQALDAAVAAEPYAAQGLLEQAAGLYRGPLLEGTSDEPWVEPDRTHLEQRYRGALRSLAQSHQGQGRTEAAIGMLQRLVRIDLTDEAAQRSLIQALADAGRTAEALAQYRLCKEVLAAELGVAPSSQTVALAQRLKAPGVAAEASPSGASTLEAHVAGASAVGAAPTPRRHQLPHGLPSLIGRDGELAALRALCERADTRLLTLIGVGGVGKTQLALRLGAALQGRFEHGVAFVSLAALAPQSEPQWVASTVARALGLVQSGAATPQELLREHLADKQLLLVLDNFEHLLPHAARLLSEWLAHAAQLTLLVTSRTPLHVQGERLFALGPLALPNAAGGSDGATPPASLARVPALALFVQRAAAIDSTFALTADNAAAVSAICTHLDGLPLAIELAAARIRLFAPADLLARLDRRFALLSHGLLDSPDRHRSLGAVLDWSYQLLSPAAQQLFAAMSVFRGGATLEAIQAVCGAGDGSVDDVVDALLDHNLLVVHVDAGGDRRFGMLESVWAYAAQRLNRAADLQHQHAQYFCAMVQNIECQLRGPQQKALLDRLEADHDNLRAALRWGIHNDATLAHQLSASMSELWIVRGHATEAQDFMGRILALRADVPPAHRARALQTASRMQWRLGNFQAADTLLKQVLKLQRAVGDSLGMARALNGLAAMRGAMGQPEDAVPMLQLALEQARSSGQGFAVSSVLMNLGQVLINLGEYRLARTYVQESEALQRQLNDSCGLCYLLMTAGELARVHNDIEGAQLCFDEALDLARGNGDRPLIATALSLLCQTAADRRDFSRSEALINECLAISRTHGLKVVTATALVCSARVALSQGQLDRAGEALTESQALYRDIGGSVDTILCLALSVRCAIMLGNMALARERMGALLTRAGRLYGVYAAAVIEVGATLAMGNHEPAFAIRLLATAEAARRRMDTPACDNDRTWQEPLLDAARAQLGAQRAELFWKQGLAQGQEVGLQELTRRYGATTWTRGFAAQPCAQGGGHADLDYLRTSS